LNYIVSGETIELITKIQYAKNDAPASEQQHPNPPNKLNLLKCTKVYIIYLWVEPAYTHTGNIVLAVQSPRQNARDGRRSTTLEEHLYM
jgi:hypothetical protein